MILLLPSLAIPLPPAGAWTAVPATLSFAGGLNSRARRPVGVRESDRIKTLR